MSKAQRLREMIAAGPIVFGPGVFDALSARLAQQAGFSMVFGSGYGIAATRLAAPDFGLLSATEMLEAAGAMAAAVDVPLIADLDTGYGNPLNVIRTVREAVGKGVAGFILEDQEWPKKCGHFAGKRVIPAGDHAAKIRAAVEARGDSGLVIVARTDSRAVHGLDDAIARGRLYAEAGADVIFVEAPQSRDELVRVAESLKGIPLLANMVEGGRTPTLPAAELEGLGFRLGVFPLSGLFSAAAALERCYRHLAVHGTSGGLEGLLDFASFEAVVETPAWRRLEEKYSGP
ncbi:MAG: oxaloacetate decarboxylase [Magnetospirillum sp. WYHS-4]